MYFGREGDFEFLSSIERIDAQALLEEQKDVAWELLDYRSCANATKMTGRIDALVIPISSHEILIMGGLNCDDVGLHDGYIFNTETVKLKREFNRKS